MPIIFLQKVEQMSAPSPPVVSNSIPRGTPNFLEFWWDAPLTGTVTQYRIRCDALSIDELYNAADERYAYFTVPSNSVFYQFYITAWNGAAESDPAYFPPWQAGNPTGPPTSIGLQVTPSTISMNWTAPVTPNTLQYYLTEGVPLNQSNASDVLQVVQYAETSSITLSPNRAYNLNVRAFTTPGWSEPTNTLTYGRVYGCFITNAYVFTNMSGIDTNGNQVVIGYIRNSTAPVTLYNRYGVAVQTLSAATAANDLTIIYISADGYSNLWIARINTTGIIAGPPYYNTIKFDLNGNIIIPFMSGGNVTVYDKTGATITSLVSSGVIQNIYAYIIKLSPSGVWSGVNDPNTWVTRCIISGNPPTTNHSVRMQNTILDSENNIICQCVAQNATSVSQTVTVYDQNSSAIGSGITLSSAVGAVLINSIVIKYASNGLFTNSWRAYATSPINIIQTYINQINVNKYNQVIAAFRYRDPNCAIYGSDNAMIGGVLPFTSTLGITNNYSETALVRFCSSGIASLSWRAPIYSSSLNTLSKNDNPFSVLVDSNDNIYLTGFSEFGTPGNTTVPLFVCASNDTSFISTVSLGYNNLFTAKYTNTGTPLWVTLFKGTNTPASNANTNFALNNLNGNTGTTPQYLKTFIDRENNICLIGAYSRGPFDIINRNDALLYTTALPGNSNVSAITATYAVRITNEGSNADFAILNTLSTPTVQNTIVPIQYAVTSSNDIYILESCFTTISATSSVQVGVYGSSDINTVNLSTTILTGNAFGLIVKFTSSLSTMSMATLQQSTFIFTTMAINYMKLDSNDVPIVSGTYRNQLNVSDFGSSSFDFTRTTSLPDRLGLFVTKLTGTPSNSWVGQTSIGGNIGSSNGNALIQTSATFYPAVNFGVNLSTNSIYTGAYTLSSIYTLYDGYNSTVKTMGFASTNLSNVTFFCSYPSDGRVTLS